MHVRLTQIPAPKTAPFRQAHLLAVTPTLALGNVMKIIVVCLFHPQIQRRDTRTHRFLTRWNPTLHSLHILLQASKAPVETANVLQSRIFLILCGLSSSHEIEMSGYFMLQGWDEWAWIISMLAACGCLRSNITKHI